MKQDRGVFTHHDLLFRLSVDGLLSAAHCRANSWQAFRQLKYFVIRACCVQRLFARRLCPVHLADEWATTSVTKAVESRPSRNTQ